MGKGFGAFNGVGSFMNKWIGLLLWLMLLVFLAIQGKV
jgi:hypothetical protein